MQENKTVLITKNLSDVFYQLKNVNNLQILSGCTQEKNIKEKFITLYSIPELCTIEKKERYIEMGAAVTIADLLKAGEKKLPKFILSALSSIGNYTLKNSATVGGNICAKDIKHTLWAPFLVSAARLEIKNQNETMYIPLSKFEGVPEGSILTKIRLPVNEWEVEIFKRVGPTNSISQLSASFAFLVNTERGIITDIKIAFTGAITFFSQEFENKIIGTHLPLSEKKIDEFIQDADAAFDDAKKGKEIAPILKSQFLNLLRNSLEQLT